MTGRWKAWKTTNRFPPLPTTPWKSRKDGEIPTFPPPGVAPRGRVENQRAVFHSPPRGARDGDYDYSPPHSQTKPSGLPPERQEKGRHYPLVRRCLFSIILHWKRKSSSVSFFVWKMLNGGIASTSASRTSTQRSRTRSWWKWRRPWRRDAPSISGWGRAGTPATWHPAGGM